MKGSGQAMLKLCPHRPQRDLMLSEKCRFVDTASALPEAYVQNRTGPWKHGW